MAVLNAAGATLRGVQHGGPQLNGIDAGGAAAVGIDELVVATGVADSASTPWIFVYNLAGAGIKELSRQRVPQPLGAPYYADNWVGIRSAKYVQAKDTTGLFIAQHWASNGEPGARDAWAAFRVLADGSIRWGPPFAPDPPGGMYDFAEAAGCLFGFDPPTGGVFGLAPLAVDGDLNLSLASPEVGWEIPGVTSIAGASIVMAGNGRLAYSVGDANGDAHSGFLNWDGSVEPLTVSHRFSGTGQSYTGPPVVLAAAADGCTIAQAGDSGVVIYDRYFTVVDDLALPANGGYIQTVPGAMGTYLAARYPTLGSGPADLHEMALFSVVGGHPRQLNAHLAYDTPAGAGNAVLLNTTAFDRSLVVAYDIETSSDHGNGGDPDGGFDNNGFGRVYLTFPLRAQASPLRLAQRDDGLAISAHPRLSAGQGATSAQLGATPRVGSTNTYS